MVRPLLTLLLIALFASLLPLDCAGKDKIAYGEGLIVNIPMPIAEVETVVADVAENGVIRGTREYNKDEFVAGAVGANSPHVFPAWTDPGKALYKVRKNAIDPRNFKDGGDVGTLEVRYVLLPQGEKNTVLRIDALFEEDFRRVIHQSNGSVETSEYKDIREHLDAIDVMKNQNVEAEKERREMLAAKQNGGTRLDSSSSSTSASTETTAHNVPPEVSAPSESSSDTPMRVEVPASAETATKPDDAPLLTLEQRLKGLRQQVERLVKEPGAPLKSAPFHTAGTLQLLPAGTEILIVINTPYWYGIETHEGQHGWILRDDLEQLK